MLIKPQTEKPLGRFFLDFRIQRAKVARNLNRVRKAFLNRELTAR
jgi:hypothetical protein